MLRRGEALDGGFAGDHKSHSRQPPHSAGTAGCSGRAQFCASFRARAIDFDDGEDELERRAPLVPKETALVPKEAADSADERIQVEFWRSSSSIAVSAEISVEGTLVGTVLV